MPASACVRVLPSAHPRGPAPGHLAQRHRALCNRRDARSNPRLKDLAAAIAAGVVVQEEPLDAHEPMKLDPLRQMRRLVP
jgi:hypothetical protein